MQQKFLLLPVILRIFRRLKKGPEIEDLDHLLLDETIETATDFVTIEELVADYEAHQN